METTKKVDVGAIMQRAKEKTEEVKSSAEKVEGKVSSFRIIPNFTKFEFNGNILRNVKTKNPISPKTGRTKYQIFDDAGKSHNLSKEEIRLLLPVEAEKVKEPVTKKEKAPKAPKQAKEPKIKEPKAPKEPKIKSDPVSVVIPEELSDLSTKEILALPGPNHKKIFLLHRAGKSNKEIQEIINSPIPTIARDIWRYNTGKVQIQK